MSNYYREIEEYTSALNGFTPLEQAIRYCKDVSNAILRQEALERHQDLQTLIFKKENFSRESAVKWAGDNGYRNSKVDETGSSYRLRQREPSDFEEGSFRSIPWPRNDPKEGLTAVVGKKIQTRKKRSIFNFWSK